MSLAQSAAISLSCGAPPKLALAPHAPGLFLTRVSIDLTDAGG